MKDLKGTVRGHPVLAFSLLLMMAGLGLFLPLRQPKAGRGRGDVVAPPTEARRPETTSEVPIHELASQHRQELPAPNDVPGDPRVQTDQADVPTDGRSGKYELFHDWGPYERATLLRHRLEKVTLEQYEQKWAAGDHEPVEASNLKELVEDETGRPRPTSIRYGADGTRQVTLSEEEAPEAWALLAAIKANDERVREYEKELRKLAAVQESQGE